jgi:hypothetical protein
MMKTRTLILIATAASQILLAVARFLPKTSGWFSSDSALALATQVALHFTFLSIGLSLLLVKESWDAQVTRDALLLRLPPTTIKPLRDDEFYPRFQAEITTAQSLVHISYFSPSPPDAFTDPVRRAYYAGLPALMRRNGHVQFKRLIRRSRENERWLTAQLALLNGCPNVDVAILDDVDEAKRMGLALSVQVIDEKLAWLVALGSHDRDSPHRDLFVDNAQAAIALNRYFLRLWALSTVLLRNGQPTDEGRMLLQRPTAVRP